MDIKEIKKDLTKEIVNLGLAKAADSISFFAKGNKVLLQSIDVSFKPYSEVAVNVSRKQGDLHLLTTEIKGDTEGVCFLVLDQNDVSQILPMALPAVVLDDPEKRKIMGEAFLLEFDNIVTASVVTVFSNFLETSLYGYVPNHEEVHSDNLKELLKEKISFKNKVLYFKVNMISDDINISPKFIWVFDEAFANKIEEHILSGQNAEVISRILTK